MSRVISHFVLVCFNGAFIYLFSSKGLPFLLYLIFLNNFVDTDVFIWNESLENSVWTFCTYCYKYHVYILRLLHCYLNFRCLTAKDKNNQRAIKKYFYVCFYFDNVCVDILSCFLSSIMLQCYIMALKLNFPIKIQKVRASMIEYIALPTFKGYPLELHQWGWYYMLCQELFILWCAFRSETTFFHLAFYSF